MATTKFITLPDSSGQGASREEMLAGLEAMKDLNAIGVKLVHLEPGEPVPPDVVVLTDGEGLGTGPVVGGVATDGYKVSHPSFGYPDLSRLTTKKIPHKDMILDDVCTNCACCGQPLTDSVSVQRGLGPRCSRKGYSEDPVECEEMDAFICLSEFQELVEFLTEHYKPLGARGLVNGLVRVASLNRPRGGEQKEGNEKLFRACCDAIEALGYPKMANLLRDTLVVAWLNKSDEPGEDGISYLRTKAYRTPGWIRSEIMQKIGGGVIWDKKTRTFRIPMHEKGSPSMLITSMDSGKSNKRVIWEALLKAFEGYAAKIDGHAVPIRVKDRTLA